MTRPRKALRLIMPLAACADASAYPSWWTIGPRLPVFTSPCPPWAPAYSMGDVALIRPCDTVEAGSDYMLRRKGRSPGTYRLVRVDRVTPTYIFARQFNPPMVRRMARQQWTPAYKVTVKYNGEPAPGAANLES
jgi:hypothetical protein